MRKQNKKQKQTKEEKQLAERKAYLMGLIDAVTLKRFTRKRAEKLASIVLWGNESRFKNLVDASKSGIIYADRFVAIAEFLAAQGIKSTKDLWGKSDYDYNRDYMHIIDGLTELSLCPVAQNARAIVYNKEFRPVVNAYKHDRKVKELWVGFGDGGMLNSASLSSSSVHTYESCPAFEWVEISEQSQKMAISALLSGVQVQLPRI